MRGPFDSGGASRRPPFHYQQVATMESRQDVPVNRRGAVRRMVMACVLVPLVAACATTGEGRGQYDRHRITETELLGLEERTPLLSAVQRLRPTWLQGRGPTRIQGAEDRVVVYVANQRAGGAEVLARWTTAEVRELEFLDAINATQRFGTGHGAGAILIVLR